MAIADDFAVDHTTGNIRIPVGRRAGKSYTAMDLYRYLMDAWDSETPLLDQLLHVDDFLAGYDLGEARPASTGMLDIR